MILWLLRCFTQFRDLESLSMMQARQVKEADARALRESQSDVTIELLENERNVLVVEAEELRGVNQELLTEKILLQDRLESAVADRDRLWDTMQEALNNERLALRMQINHAVQKAGGGIPYPEAHSLPAESVRAPQRPGGVGRGARILPSEMAARNTRNFVETFVETLEQQNKPA